MAAPRAGAQQSGDGFLFGAPLENCGLTVVRWDERRRIFLEITSPSAQHFKKQMSERDPEKRKEILASMQALCADRERLNDVRDVVVRIGTPATTL